MQDDPSFASFDLDVANNAGYLYTTHARLSSKLANRRLTQAALAVTSFAGKRVIDIGCGDGTYTQELLDQGKPALICGIDPAGKAIELARTRSDGRPITYDVQSAYELTFGEDSFDIAHMRGVLHHMDRPYDAIAEAFRVAPTLVIIEPNAFNPVLKLLERYSRYHIQHGEKSYSPRLVARWVGRAGGRIAGSYWVGLVPFFCPDWFAGIAKRLEPLVEHAPVLRNVCCAVYVVRAVRIGE